MSQSHGTKGGTTDEVCQEPCLFFFLELLLVLTVILTFKIFYKHKNTLKLLRLLNKQVISFRNINKKTEICIRLLKLK